MLEIESPKAEIEIKEIQVFPNNPNVNNPSDRIEKKISKTLDSTNFINIKPNSVPIVIFPQKFEITLAPSVWGSIL